MIFPARNLNWWVIFHGYVSHNQMVKILPSLGAFPHQLDAFWKHRGFICDLLGMAPTSEVGSSEETWELENWRGNFWKNYGKLWRTENNWRIGTFGMGKLWKIAGKSRFCQQFDVKILICQHFLVGGLEHFWFFHILGISSSQLTFMFFGGVAQPPTSFDVTVVLYPICSMYGLHIYIYIPTFTPKMDQM